MVIYVSRSTSLKADQTPLPQGQADLAPQRRGIGKLAERLDVLERDYELLAAVSLGREPAMAINDPRLAQWRDASLLFRSGNSEWRRGSHAAQNPNGRWCQSGWVGVV